MALREGKWKCTYCAAVNRGRDLSCAGCGATRDADVKFFCDGDAPEVTDAELTRLAQGGADWICEMCGTSNRNSMGQCGQCGAPRGASRSHQTSALREGAAAPSPEAPRASNIAHAQAFASRAPQPTRRFLTRRVAFIAAALIALLVATGVAGLGGLAYYLTRTHETELTVASVAWRRSMEVEELQTVGRAYVLGLRIK